MLHGERGPIGRGRRPTWAHPWSDLPDGSFVVMDDEPQIVVADHLARWDAVSARYAEWRPRPRTGDAKVLTPRPVVAEPARRSVASVTA